MRESEIYAYLREIQLHISLSVHGIPPPNTFPHHLSTYQTSPNHSSPLAFLFWTLIIFVLKFI